MSETNQTKTFGAYEVHESRVEWLNEKLAKLNRRAQKLGLSPISIRYTGAEKLVPVLDRDGKETGEVDRYVVAEVTGTTPKLNGWSFVATLQHAGEEAGTIIRTIPGFAGQLPQQYRTASRFTCDLCHTVRARKDTYVVRSEEGEFKQIGSNCLAAFLGGADPQAVAQWAQFAFSVDEAVGSANGGGGRGEYRIDLDTWLEHVAAVLRVDGKWVSRGAARAYAEASGGLKGIPSTSELASGRLFARTKEEREATAQYAPTAEDKEFATAALDWTKATFHAKDPAERSDFEHNLVVATSQEAIQSRTLGIAAAAVGMYWKSLVREQERKARAEVTGNSDHFGEVGQRVVFFAKLLAPVKSWESQFGTTYLYKMITKEGNVVTWFASAPLQELEDAQDFIVLIGTVKKHDEFKGEKQTVVNRVAIPTQKQIDKATGQDKVKKAQKKAANDIQKRFEQLGENDW